MIFIQWTNAAFHELGADLGSRFVKLKGLRQLVIKRNWRVIYDFEEDTETIFIVAVQNCRQKLPAMRDLKKRKRQID